MKIIDFKLALVQILGRARPGTGAINPQPPDVASEVVADGSEDGIVEVAVAMGEIIAANAVLVLEMTDHWLDGAAAFHLTFDGQRDAPLLLGCVDFGLVCGRRIVAAVAGVGVEPIDRISDEVFDRRDDGCQRLVRRSALGSTEGSTPSDSSLLASSRLLRHLRVR